MKVQETVCPRHALLAQLEADGTIIRGCGCVGLLREMFEDEACWPIDQRPVINDDVLEYLWQTFVEDRDEW